MISKSDFVHPRGRYYKRVCTFLHMYIHQESLHWAYPILWQAETSQREYDAAFLIFRMLYSNLMWQKQPYRAKGAAGSLPATHAESSAVCWFHHRRYVFPSTVRREVKRGSSGISTSPATTDAGGPGIQCQHDLQQPRGEMRLHAYPSCDTS